MTCRQHTAFWDMRVNIVAVWLWVTVFALMLIGVVMTDWSRFEQASGGGSEETRVIKKYIPIYHAVYIDRDNGGI